ncbi:MAG: aconitate hydratase AcnA [Armatimonadetes bacterium]|nr:aconitate hydratase AcnA [Armatimonadota bacterium]
MINSFDTKKTLESGGKSYTYYSLKALEMKGFRISRLPYSLRILLENLLRSEDNKSVFRQDIEAMASWNAKAEPSKEISFTPARVILQDFTGVPCVVDLAAMRDAMSNLGGDPKKINPLQPVELVIDHSVQVDAYGAEAALLINRDLEFERNQERYEFLKWGQKALANFRVVPPNTGIVHQVNLENLARVTFVNPENVAYPDTLVGTDSHTTMINGLGVLGWGVGGIEAEAAMLGQPVTMLIPQVIGFKLTGKLSEGATATDLVLTVTEMLRKKGVVGKFVEYFGPGLASMPLADRATIANMAPEYGATCGIFPVDAESLRYMRLTGRTEEQITLTEAYYKAQGLFWEPGQADPEFTDVLELDLGSVQPSVAGPKRPQDRLLLNQIRDNFNTTFKDQLAPEPAKSFAGGVAVLEAPTETEKKANAAVDDVHNGAVVLAAITSCTNTSNPSVLLAAGLVAKKAVEKGLMTKPWVKTSLAPGSRVAGDIYTQAGLMPYMEALNFFIVGYGCTTCIGNSGPLPAAISKKVNDDNLVVCSVLSGNRNFEGRIGPDIKANYLMSPPLVVAYALAGTVNIDLYNDPLGNDKDGNPVFLKDIWPTQAEVAEAVAGAVNTGLFDRHYADVFKGDEKWQAISVTGADRFSWDEASTYIKNPPYFEGMSAEAPTTVPDLHEMKVIALLGDSVTTDHISPAGSIKANSPGGQFLIDRGVDPKMFNSYGSRRGNDDVMVRGTFANIRLRNQLAPGTEGGYTTYLPTGEVEFIYDAAMKYKASGTPLLVIAGKEYGTGSSRDWAAKGTFMLGIKAVLAESFERIHRSNLVGMGVLPLEFTDGQSAASLGLDGHETYDLENLAQSVASEFKDGKTLTLKATSKDGSTKSIKVKVRIDTPQEVQYYVNGGILQFVLRQLLNS